MANGTVQGIILEKGPRKVKFDIKFGTPKGHVFGAMIIPEIENVRQEVWEKSTKKCTNYLVFLVEIYLQVQVID